MPPRRTRNDGNAHVKEEANREMRRRRLDLFIQQFEKEAQERMNELEARLENMLSTVDKVFKVELMKMLPSLQNTLIGDLIEGEETSASEVSIAMQNESVEMQQPLARVRSKRVKSTDSKPAQKSSTRTTKGAKGTKGTRTLGSSNSTGNLGGPSLTGKRAQSRLTKASDQTVPAKPKLRSVVSAGDLHCSMAGSAAHVTVTTAQGQTMCFSEETKDDIDLDLLDDVAMCQMQKLKRLMDYLASQSRCNH
ncbi:borealin-2 [Etheostoma spectabile]|uniref:borealin-2 n=1 Tax=Etheostoma spectabile TaxID=54343 RepID=UPI0013AFBA4B|nr:borealin-2-like [Etheostoma spectabile]